MPAPRNMIFHLHGKPSEKLPKTHNLYLRQYESGIITLVLTWVDSRDLYASCGQRKPNCRNHGELCCCDSKMEVISGPLTPLLPMVFAYQRLPRCPQQKKSASIKRLSKRSGNTLVNVCFCTQSSQSQNRFLWTVTDCPNRCGYVLALDFEDMSRVYRRMNCTSLANSLQDLAELFHHDFKCQAMAIC